MGGQGIKIRPVDDCIRIVTDIISEQQDSLKFARKGANRRRIQFAIEFYVSLNEHLSRLKQLESNDGTVTE